MPGRGVPGRGGGGVGDPKGLFPGRGVAGRGGWATGVSGITGFSATGSGVVSTGATFFGAAGFLGLVSFAGIAALRRLATGSSMVEEAERTNSPISCNLARTSLLS